MAVYDILPTTNLKAEDIRDSLNASGGSVDDDFTTYFTTAANINMWSRRKPVALPTNFCQDFDSTASNYMAEWWKGEDGDCGISFSLYNTMDAAVAATTGGLNGWSYILPTGDSTQPFRLGDFAGYNRNAAAPFKNFTFPSRVGQGATVKAMFEYNVTTIDGSSLQLSDLGTLENCYLGVALYRTSSGDLYTWNTADDTLANGKYTVEIDCSGLALASDWVAVPFLCTAQQPQWEALQTATYYTIPMVGSATFSVLSSVDSLIVYGVYVYNTGATLPSYLQYKFSYQNYSGGSTTNNYMFLTKAGGDTPTVQTIKEYSEKLPDFSVSVGSTYNYPYDYDGNEWATVYNTNFDASYVEWLSISIGSGRLVENVQILHTSDAPLESV